jgi:hypothetical protein
MELDQLRALVHAGHEPSRCPPAELLARAATGEADARERRTIADHLAGCASCSEEYRAAIALGPWARAASDDPTFSAPPRRRAGAWRPTTLAYAATVLLAVGAAAVLAALGLTLRADNARLTAMLANRRGDDAPRPDAGGNSAKTIATLEKQLAEALAPSVNSPIVDLLPRDTVRGNPSTPVPGVAAGARIVTFVITPVSDPADRDHEIEVVDATGVVRWRGSGLRPNAERTFTVTMSTALLSAGTCHVRLYERRDSSSRLIADYPIDVQR